MTGIAVTETSAGAVYVTQDGDTLDHIAWRYYGREFGTTEALVAANTHVHGAAVLAAGIAITLPDLPAPAVPALETIRLFD